MLRLLRAVDLEMLEVHRKCTVSRVQPMGIAKKASGGRIEGPILPKARIFCVSSQRFGVTTLRTTSTCL
jgi:hypothetical protein